MNISESGLLWGVLVILLLLVAAVGKKAAPEDVELNPEYKCKRPMISFEMRADNAPKIFKNWDVETKRKLREAIWWDYLFIFIYPAAIATACFIAGRYLDSLKIIPFKYSLIIVFLQLMAALFDAVENYALLSVLQGVIDYPWPKVARWCAIIKFGMVATGILYAVIIGGGLWLIRAFGCRVH